MSKNYKKTDSIHFIKSVFCDYIPGIYGTPSPFIFSFIPCKVVQAVIIKLIANTVSVTLIF